jgi:hypothetical protein
MAAGINVSAVHDPLLMTPDEHNTGYTGPARAGKHMSDYTTHCCQCGKKNIRRNIEHVSPTMFHGIHQEGHVHT